MFQYISDIIKNISPQQRLWALVVTLITVIAITLGGDIIDAFSNSNTALENRLTSLEVANRQLNEQNQGLQTLILESQIQCTKDITQVRQKILDELNQIEREMRMSNQTLQMVTRDSTVSSVRPIQLPNQGMLHLKEMKNKLETEIKNTK